MDADDTSREIVRAFEDGRRTIAALKTMSRCDPVRLNELEGMAAVVADPAQFWAQAALGAVQADAGQPELVAASIRASAARLSSGDHGGVREALLGQAAWLSAIAVRLAAAEVSGPGHHEAKAAYLKLALRAAESAAKCLASAAALEAVASGNAQVK